MRQPADNLGGAVHVAPSRCPSTPRQRARRTTGSGRRGGAAAPCPSRHGRSAPAGGGPSSTTRATTHCTNRAVSTSTPMPIGLRPDFLRQLGIDLGHQVFPVHGHRVSTHSNRSDQSRIIRHPFPIPRFHGPTRPAGAAPDRPEAARGASGPRTPPAGPIIPPIMANTPPRPKPVRQQGASLVRPVLGTGFRTRQTLHRVRGFR